jgi:hypothetical protein
MRALSSFLTTLAATAIGTSALEASIYTFGPIIDRQDLKPTLISSATLQQLLDLRSGSSTTSIIGRADEDSIELLSNLAGFPSPLFNSPTDNGYENTLLVLLEGLTDSIGTSTPQSSTNQINMTLIKSFLRHLTPNEISKRISSFRVSHGVFDEFFL